MEMIYICPRCGKTYFSENDLLCEFCGCQMIVTTFKSEEYMSIHGLENRKYFDNKLYNEYCYTNPLFSSYQFDKRQQEEDDMFALPEEDSKRCPKCGNTEFTPVRKKYSILTGFLTNKVELICNKCGAKIK